MKLVYLSYKTGKGHCFPLHLTGFQEMAPSVEIIFFFALELIEYPSQPAWPLAIVAVGFWELEYGNCKLTQALWTGCRKPASAGSCYVPMMFPGANALWKRPWSPCGPICGFWQLLSWHTFGMHVPALCWVESVGLINSLISYPLPPHHSVRKEAQNGEQLKMDIQVLEEYNR